MRRSKRKTIPKKRALKAPRIAGVPKFPVMREIVVGWLTSEGEQHFERLSFDDPRERVISGCGVFYIRRSLTAEEARDVIVPRPLLS